MQLELVVPALRRALAKRRKLMNTSARFLGLIILPVLIHFSSHFPLFLNRVPYVTERDHQGDVMSKAPVQSSTQPERPKALDTLIAITGTGRRLSVCSLNRVPSLVISSPM